MDKADESDGKTPGATTAAEMDPMVMMERFNQMQTALQQMQENMQHLQQEVTSFREDNARLKTQLHRVSTKAGGLSPPTPNNGAQASQLASPVVIKMEEDDWSENLQAVNETSPCANTESYGTSARYSCDSESEQSVKEESGISCKVESDDRARMKWEYSGQGMESMTIVRQPPAQHIAQTAPDLLSPNGQAPEIVKVTLQRKRNSDKQLSLEKTSTPKGPIRTGAAPHQCVKCSDGRNAAKMICSSSSSLITPVKKRRFIEKASVLKCADHHENAADLATASHCGSCYGKGGNLLIVDRGELEKEFSRLVTELSEKQMSMLEPQKDTECITRPAQETGSISDSSGETEQMPSQNDTEIVRPVAAAAAGPKPADCRLTDKHFAARIPPSATKAKPRKNCLVCYATMKKRGATAKERKNRRQSTTYWCPTCAVPLCIEPCFRVYHTKRDYTED